MNSYDNRESFIAERYDQIISEDMTDRDRIAEVIAKLSEEPELADRAASVLVCHPSDFPMLAERFFFQLRDQVKAVVRTDAEQRANAEADAATPEMES